jgi:hypothetical protein
MVNETPSVTQVTRRRARSGIGYANDVVLHATGRRRVLLRPWYITHNAHPDGLALKLLVQVVDASGNWTDAEAISLDERATAELSRALEEHHAVARSGRDGTVLLIRGEGIATAGEADARELVPAILGLLQRKDVLAHLTREDLTWELLAALQTSVRLQELRQAVSQLRMLLDSGVVEEKHYQDWCSTHSWAFGSAHTTPDPIRRVTRTDDVDILLPRVLTGFRDIVELKRPDSRVLVRDSSRGTIHWSSDAAQAIGQCHDYIDNLHMDAERGLRGRPEIVVYHPRATIVIGRSATWKAEWHRALAGLNRRLTDITLMTYDQLLAQGDELIRLFTPGSDPRCDQQPGPLGPPSD